MGYNNGVIFLNEACKTFWSYSVQDEKTSEPIYYAEARSFNLADLSVAYRSGFGDVVSYSGSTARYVPYTYGSKVTGFTTYDVKNTKSFPLQTFYGTSLLSDSFRSTEYYKIITQRVNGKSMHDYWTATKCAGSKSSTYPSMGLAYITGAYVGSLSLFTASTTIDGGSSQSCYLRPIVRLNLEYVEFGVSGNGTSETPWRLKFPD